MSQYKRCETCKEALPDRDEDGNVVCSLFEDSHAAYEKCSFWESRDK